MTNKVFIATSLDGYIASRTGSVAWLDDFPNPSNTDYGYHEFIRGIDAIVMGRHTFEKLCCLTEWPYSKKVFVLSNELTEIDPVLVDRAELVNGDLKNLINKLHQRGYHHLYVDGGQTIQRFLKRDLIDELIISTLPILLGEGIPLFKPQLKRIDFQHSSTEVFEGGVVKSHYIRRQ